MKRKASEISLTIILTLLACHSSSVRAFSLSKQSPTFTWRLFAKPAGSFFNPVPQDDDDSGDDNENNSMDSSIQELIKSRNAPPRAAEPSTINGVPTSQAGVGFGSNSASKSTPKPFVGIGKPVNDVTKPEYDDQGYTVYTNEQTGEKARVFEALVDYPCDFTMKIVGANEGLFVEEMLAVVAESCNVEAGRIVHSVRSTGKWTSVTVQAPVQSAEMLYALYENVDKDPRVKFKF